ncbi:MAG: AtpZ/AtpI family protein [Candidatus Komeilibacteria bacterium]
MSEQKPDNKSWQSLALAIGAEATGWIVGPVLLALWLGKTLDQRFASAPLWLLICMIVAFVGTIMGLLRLAKRYLK